MTAAGALLLGSGLARLSARDLPNSSRRMDMKNKVALILVPPVASGLNVNVPQHSSYCFTPRLVGANENFLKTCEGSDHLMVLY
jgi:hypothetical protein